MSSKEIQTLKFEKSKLIGEYLSLKKEYQELFYKYKVVCQENILLKKQIDTRNEKLITQINENKESTDKSISHEKKCLVAKISQLHRISTSNITLKSVATQSTQSKESPSKKSTPVKSSPIYEVDALLKHRRRAQTREFLVRWKGFEQKDDTWEKERNLSCPQILDKYKRKHRIQ